MRNPGYFMPGLPYIERIDAPVDEDSASRIAAFLAGKYDIGYTTAATSSGPSGRRSRTR